MNLKKRLIIANASAVIIPLLITVLAALAYFFIVGKVSDSDLSFRSTQEISQLRLQLIGNEQSLLRESPQLIEDKSFQKELTERLEGIAGEVIILQNDYVLYASRNLNKVDVARLLEAADSSDGFNTVNIWDAFYSLQSIDVSLGEGTGRTDTLLLLAPYDPAGFNLTGFLIFCAIVFVLSFGATNILISYQFSRSALQPLSNLQRAASEITLGNLNHEIVEEGDREIRELCRDLEAMRLKLKNSVLMQLKYEDNRKLLISSISHDLKTPVTSIKGYVEGLLDEIANTPEKKEKYLRTIYRKAEQVDTMIDDLLLYAKLDMQQSPYTFEKTDLEEFLKDGLLESEHEFERDSIKLFFSSDLQGKRMIPLDRVRMKRVIMNILDNSRKYMNKEQGQIIISLRETPASLIIEIRDNGRGIAQHDLPRIFDRFFRSDTARSEIKGSGLGLAIARQIVEDHEGRIWAVSHGDEGMSVLISLPKG